MHAVCLRVTWGRGCHFGGECISYMISIAIQATHFAACSTGVITKAKHARQTGDDDCLSTFNGRKP